jgi:hypothetical protein
LRGYDYGPEDYAQWMDNLIGNPIEEGASETVVSIVAFQFLDDSVVVVVNTRLTETER